MTFTLPFTSLASPEGGIITVWSTSKVFLKVTLFQHYRDIGKIETTSKHFNMIININSRQNTITF